MDLPLLSLEEASKKVVEIPYIYELSNKNKALIVLGSRHTNNPKDKQFKVFEDIFDRFNPDIVFVEGGFDRETCKDKKEAISIGENAFLSYLAKSNEISIESWEPYSEEVTAILLKTYSKDVIFAHRILQTIPQYHRLGKPKGYIERHILSFKKTTQWKNFDYSLDHLRDIHKQIFKKDIDFEDVSFYAFSPFSNFSSLNRISAEEMRLRDAHAVKVITEAFSKQSKVLAIMGSSHAVIQETAYRAYFTKK